MQVYRKKEVCEFSYPEDMAKILAYLKENGEIFVEDSIIEQLYFRFSEERFSASWMDADATVYDYKDGPCEISILEEFANWLTGIDLEEVI